MIFKNRDSPALPTNIVYECVQAPITLVQGPSVCPQVGDAPPTPGPGPL